MKSANSKESKTRKRKVALANLEKQHKNMLAKPGTDFTMKAVERIEKEIVTLKSRILN